MRLHRVPPCGHTRELATSESTGGSAGATRRRGVWWALSMVGPSCSVSSAEISECSASCERDEAMTPPTCNVPNVCDACNVCNACDGCSVCNVCDERECRQAA